jgi:lipoprotein
MKVTIFMMTALALILTIGSASCNKKEGKGETPAGRHGIPTR